MAVQAIDLQVDDVREGTRLLAEAYGWRVLSSDDNFGELDAGGMKGPGQLIVDVCRDA